MLREIYARATKQWVYTGCTNKYMDKHSWTNGHETVTIYFMRGVAPHAGYRAEVEGAHKDATLVLSNGFVSKFEALVLADMHMRGRPVACFMGGMRQDEWLAKNGRDYEFEHIRPDRFL